jgi:hypothetical protein
LDLQGPKQLGAYTVRLLRGINALRDGFEFIDQDIEKFSELEGIVYE